MRKLTIALLTGTMLHLYANDSSAQEKTTGNHIRKQFNNHQMEKTDKQQIENLLLTYQDLLNASDAQKISELYTKDGVFMPTEAPTATGTKNLIASYEYVFSQIKLNVVFHIEEIVVDGNIAYATTGSQGTTLIHATNETVSEANRELFVFEKENSLWKISKYMFNKTKPGK